MFAHGLRHGTDKITHHGYERFYEYFLSDYVKRSEHEDISLFEIGIDRKNSLRMWKSMFAHASIYGMDINHSYAETGCVILKGDQSSKSDLKNIIKQTNKMDIIIDDGSHVPEHQLFTFNYLFRKMLKYGGLYIIEDVETNYWKNGSLYNYNIDAGYGSANNVVKIFADAVDIVNREFLTPKQIKQIIKHSPIHPKNLKYISFIMFGGNCIIIKKMTKDEYVKYGKRKYRFSQYIN